LRKVTKKGLTTDYKNQEDEHFRKLQNESFASCNGNFSYFNQIMDASVQFFSNLLGFAAFFGILAMLNPLIIVFLALTTLIGFFLNRRINKWVSLNTDEKAGYEQRMQYVISASDDTAAAKDIRLYNMAKWLNDVYDKNLKGVLSWYKKYTAKLFGIASADSAITFIREGLTYLYLLYLVIKEEISVADFVLYFNVVAGFSNWLGSMLGQLSNIERLSLSVNRIREFLDYPENYRREGGKMIPGADEPCEIKLEHVSFRYMEDDKDILSNIDLTIKPGEHLAIVGLNGAGKTTLVKLICGLTEAETSAAFGVIVEEGIFGFRILRPYHHIDCERFVGDRTQHFGFCIGFFRVDEMEGYTGGYTGLVGIADQLEVIILIKVVSGDRFIES
jgi:ATP-binding cassette subfamily B protein